MYNLETIGLCKYVLEAAGFLGDLFHGLDFSEAAQVFIILSPRPIVSMHPIVTLPQNKIPVGKLRAPNVSLPVSK